MADSTREAMTACNCAPAPQPAGQQVRGQPDRRRAAAAASAASAASPPRRRRRSDAFAAVRQSPLSWS